MTVLATAVWGLFLPRTGTDLAAAVARARFAAAHPLATYDAGWFGGAAPQAYSLLAPGVTAAVGVRLSAALATVASVALFTLLVQRHRLPRPGPAAAVGTACLLADLIAARVPFSLGLAAGLGALALLAPAEGRPPRLGRGAALGAVTTLLSPLAGLFAVVVAVGMAVTGRRRAGGVLGLAAGLPMLLQMWAFEPHGFEPMGLELVVPSVGITLLVAWAAGRRFAPLRATALLYAAGTVAAFCAHSPVGANADRLALLFGVPLLAGTAPLPRRGLAAVLVGCAIWPAQFPLADLQHARDPAGLPQYTAPLLQELRALGTTGRRVEAVPGRDHWEAAQLAGHVLLARGWDTQLDTLRDPLFYRSSLSPAAYHAWLRQNAVRYVALPDGPVDWSGRTEARLLADPPSWLRPVWQGAHWRLWELADPLPLVSGPAEVGDAGSAGLTFRATRPGTVLVRMHWSRWLRADGGARPEPAPGGWTLLRVPAAGTYRLASLGDAGQ